MSKSKQKTAVRPTIRQGDVLLVPIAKLPAALTTVDPKSESRGLVLAEGEATGHAHTLDWSTVNRAGRATDGSLYFAAGDGAALTHQEHDAIPVPTGAYKIVRQREYAPEAIRTVAD